MIGKGYSIESAISNEYDFRGYATKNAYEIGLKTKEVYNYKYGL